MIEKSALAASGSDASAEQITALLHAERARVRELLSTGRTRLEQAEVVVEQRIEELESALREERLESQRLAAARDELSARLAEIQRRPPELVETGDGQRSATDEELRHRCELALEELREEKDRNRELQEQLAKTQSTAAKLAQQSGRLNWEAEKRRMLAALEAESDEGGATRSAEHLEIRNVLQSTEEFIAAKNLQIQELTERLASHENEAGTANTPPGEQVLDNDAIIRQERERLEQLQVQWQEKVRQAEIELSLERANLARQRAELNGLRAAERTSPAPAATKEADEAADRPAHGRWLARLGLTDADREPGRHF